MTHHKDSIIDTHLHLAVDALDFPAKRAVLLAELKQNGVDKSIVIADSTPESTIGSVRAAQHFSEAFRPATQRAFK